MLHPILFAIMKQQAAYEKLYSSNFSKIMFMRQSTPTILLVILWLMVSNFKKPFQNNWQQLFNGKDLDGWDTYIGPPLDDAGKKLSDTPVGLNKDPKHVFTVTDDHGEK